MQRAPKAGGLGQERRPEGGRGLEGRAGRWTEGSFSVPLTPSSIVQLMGHQGPSSVPGLSSLLWSKPSPLNEEVRLKGGGLRTLGPQGGWCDGYSVARPRGWGWGCDLGIPLSPRAHGTATGHHQHSPLSITVLLLGAGRNQGLEGEMKRKSHTFASLARSCHPFRRVWSSWTRWP